LSHELQQQQIVYKKTLMHRHITRNVKRTIFILVAVIFSILVLVSILSKIPYFPERRFICKHGQEYSTVDEVKHLTLPVWKQLMSKQPRKCLFIGIMSNCDSTQNRNAIRQWMDHYSKSSDYCFTYKFILNSIDYDPTTSIQCESILSDEVNEHHDIWFVQNSKTTSNPMIYRVESMFHHVIQTMTYSYSHIIKSDDKSFIRVDLLSRLLEDSNDISMTFAYALKQSSDERSIASTYALSISVVNALYSWSQVSELYRWENEDITILNRLSIMKHDKIDLSSKYSVNRNNCDRDRLVYTSFSSHSNMEKFMKAYINKESSEQYCKYIVDQ
jgi:hypothetical protein